MPRRLIWVTSYKAVCRKPYAYIEVQDEKLRDKWVKSLQKTYGKDVQIDLSERTIQVYEEYKEEKASKEDTA